MTSHATHTAWQDLRSAAGWLAAGVWAGLISGALIGGIGGRLAMLVLRITSDPSVVGRESDDGFIIGRVSGETLFLVLFSTAAGVLGGLLYLVVRGWLPQRARAIAYGTFGAAVGGALVVHPDGIDFSLLEPRWLAIAMFVALPGAFGVATASLTERFLGRRRAPGAAGWIAALLPLIGLAALGPAGLAIPVAAAGGWLVNRKVPLARAWHSVPVVWVGRVVLVAALAWALVVLGSDVRAIL
jgi:hypothetical protein